MPLPSTYFEEESKELEEEKVGYICDEVNIASAIRSPVPLPPLPSWLLTNTLERGATDNVSVVIIQARNSDATVPLESHYA